MSVLEDVANMNSSIGGVGAWADDRVVAKPGAQLSAASAYYDYIVWTARMRLHPHGKMQFYRLLTAAGVRRAEGAGTRMFLHLTLKDRPEVASSGVAIDQVHQYAAEHQLGPLTSAQRHSLAQAIPLAPARVLDPGDEDL